MKNCAVWSFGLFGRVVENRKKQPILNYLNNPAQQYARKPQHDPLIPHVETLAEPEFALHNSYTREMISRISSSRAQGDRMFAFRCSTSTKNIVTFAHSQLCTTACTPTWIDHFPQASRTRINHTFTFVIGRGDCVLPLTYWLTETVCIPGISHRGWVIFCSTNWPAQRRGRLIASRRFALRHLQVMLGIVFELDLFKSRQSHDVWSWWAPATTMTTRPRSCAVLGGCSICGPRPVSSIWGGQSNKEIEAAGPRLEIMAGPQNQISNVEGCPRLSDAWWRLKAKEIDVSVARNQLGLWFVS